MSVNIEKAIIPLGKTKTSLFPLNRCVPEELLPLGDVPLIEWIVKEALSCGTKEIIFFSPTQKKEVSSHFKHPENIPHGFEDFKEKYSSIEVTSFLQKNSGSAYAFSRVKEKIGEEAFALLFPDIVFSGKKTALEQLFALYRTAQKSVLALREVEDEEVESCYIVETEKIANRFYKIKKIIGKTDPQQTVSRIALAGRYILTPGIFDYLKNKEVELSVVEALNEMIAAGKTVYGHECEGEWFLMKNKKGYLHAHTLFSEKLI